MDTLVLSCADEPISQVTWRRAFNLWLKNKVVILEEYTDRFVRAAGFMMPMPAVVKLVHYVTGKRRGVRFSRENVYLRDKGRCAYCACACSKTDATFDHVVPRALGGKTRWENVVIACLPCNQRKRDRTPEQAGMRLRTQPERPKSLPEVINLRLPSTVPEEWTRYLRSVAYWHVPLEQG